MEKTIDRTEYRRSNEEGKAVEDERIEFWRRKVRIFLLQSLGASIILLVVSFLKFYNCKTALNKIKDALNNEITISSLQESRTNNNRKSFKIL